MPAQLDDVVHFHKPGRMENRIDVKTLPGAPFQIEKRREMILMAIASKLVNTPENEVTFYTCALRLLNATKAMILPMIQEHDQDAYYDEASKTIFLTNGSYMVFTTP